MGGIWEANLRFTFYFLIGLVGLGVWLPLFLYFELKTTIIFINIILSQSILSQLYCFTFACKLLFRSFTAKFELSFSCFVTEVGKAKKVESIRFALLLFCILRLKTSKSYSPAFLRMYFPVASLFCCYSFILFSTYII